MRKYLCQTDFVKKEEYKNKVLHDRSQVDCREYNRGHEETKQALQIPLHHNADFLVSRQTDKKSQQSPLSQGLKSGQY